MALPSVANVAWVSGWIGVLAGIEELARDLVADFRSNNARRASSLSSLRLCAFLCTLSLTSHRFLNSCTALEYLAPDNVCSQDLSYGFLLCHSAPHPNINALIL